jgi:ankyrin repeat protein
VLELIDHGASVRESDEANWQPLRYAAFYGHAEIVDALLKRGASVIALNSLDANDSKTVTSRLGFAPKVDGRRRKAVFDLLSTAEEKERSAPQRLSPTDSYLTFAKFGTGQETLRFYELET